MRGNIYDYMQDLIIKEGNKTISTEKYKQYIEELKLITDIKRQYYKSK